MAEYLRSPSLPAPELKSSYSSGADACEIWVDSITRALGREHASFAQRMIMEILVNNRLLNVIWKTEEIVAAENPNRTAELLALLLTSENKSSMEDSRNKVTSSTTAYSWIYKSFGKDSLDVLCVDPAFMANDSGARCPLVAYNRFTSTHITERNGIGEMSAVAAVNDLLIKFSQLVQLTSEHVSDYYLRYQRVVKALGLRNVNVNAWLDTGRKHATKFAQGLSDNYAQLKRDLANSLVTTPDSIPLLITMAMQRKDVPVKPEYVKKVVFLTDSTKQPTWYEKLPRVQYEALSKSEVAHRAAVNKKLATDFGDMVDSTGFNFG